jgi:hypothetical protein
MDKANPLSAAHAARGGHAQAALAELGERVLRALVLENSDLEPTFARRQVIGDRCCAARMRRLFPAA